MEKLKDGLYIFFFYNFILNFIIRHISYNNNVIRYKKIENSK